MLKWIRNENKNSEKKIPKKEMGGKTGPVFRIEKVEKEGAKNYPWNDIGTNNKFVLTYIWIKEFFFFLLFPMCTRNGKGCVSSLTNVFDSQNWESSHKSRPESTFYFVFTCKSRFIPRKSFQQFFCLFFKVQNSWLWSCKCFSFIPMSLLLS